MLPSDRPDAKATAIAERVARELGCSDVDDVLDALKRVLSDNADAEIHRRVLGQQRDAHRTRADAAEAECARLQRLMDRAVPWRVSDPPTDDEMRAIRWRWASGPERYQADADAHICAAMHARERETALTADRDAARAEVARLQQDITDLNAHVAQVEDKLAHATEPEQA